MRKRTVPDVWARAAEYHLNDLPGKVRDFRAVDWKILGRTEDSHKQISEASVWASITIDEEPHMALVVMQDNVQIHLEEGESEAPPWKRK